MLGMQDFIVAIGVVINAILGGLYALTFGFPSVPTAAGFIIGAIGCGVLGVVAPISFQAETLTLVGTMGRNVQERISMVFLEGVILLAVGLLGMFKGHCWVYWPGDYQCYDGRCWYCLSKGRR